MVRVNRDSDCHLHFCLRAAQTWRTYKQRKHIDCGVIEALGVQFQIKARGGVLEIFSSIYGLLNAFF
jgi:hypothetical protein